MLLQMVDFVVSVGQQLLGQHLLVVSHVVRLQFGSRHFMVNDVRLPLHALDLIVTLNSFHPRSCCILVEARLVHLRNVHFLRRRVNALDSEFCAGLSGLLNAQVVLLPEVVQVKDGLIAALIGKVSAHLFNN